MNSTQQQLQHQNFLRQELHHQHPHLQQSQIQGISHTSDPRVKVPSENFDNISQETQYQFSHLHNQGSNHSFDPSVEVSSENLPHHPKGHILGIGQSENIGTFSQKAQDLGQDSKISSNLWSFLGPPTIPHWLQTEAPKPNPVFNTGSPVPLSLYNTHPPAIVNTCNVNKINILPPQKYKNTKIYPDLP